MGNGLERKMITREKRLRTISHYNGTLETLLNDTDGEQIRQRVRTLTQINEDEVIAAIRVLSSISEAAVIVHGVAGCAASGLSFYREHQNPIYSTNLCERDTILGGEEKLREAIHRAYEERSPKVIFIVGTPVVAINNDDVNSMLYDFEEIDAKIVPVNTDGFKTKTFLTGYDLVLHSLLYYVIGQNAEKESPDEVLNIISVSERKENREAVADLLDALEIPYRFLPNGQSIEEIKKSVRGKASIVLNRDEGEYFAAKLEELYQVPYLVTKPPIGLRGTRHFLRQIAKLYQKEEQAEELIRQKEKQLAGEVFQKPLQGKKIFVEASPYEIPRFNTFLQELGGELSGIGIPYIDVEDREAFLHLESVSKTIPVIVSCGQLFEKANVLSKKPADYVVSTFGETSFALLQGAVPIDLSETSYFGYAGIRQVLSCIKRAELQKECYTPAGGEISYKAGWLKKSSHWYVKKEVG